MNKISSNCKRFLDAIFSAGPSFEDIVGGILIAMLLIGGVWVAYGFGFPMMGDF